MKVLVIGSGGREHALVWKLSKSPRVHKIYCAPGNGGIAALAECVDILATDIEGVVDFVEENQIDFTLVAPDDPLALGMVDALENKGHRAFGPRKNAAQIEASKIFAKELMRRYGIPSAQYAQFEDFDEAINYLEDIECPIVVKADGLALGKGVVIAQSKEEAKDALQAMMVDRIFGVAGDRILIEEYMTGPEVSVLAFTDGKTVVPMVSAQDHKRIFDGDQGPNTGGMGTFSPSAKYTPEIAAYVEKNIMEPTVAAMTAEGCPFKGVLYFGIMLTPEGPKVLEYNARFGDPETQVVLPRLNTDLMDILDAVIDERLSEISIDWAENAAVCVILASGGYPGSYKKSLEITGIERVEAQPEIQVFHAGTRREGEKILTSGGRVLGVTAVGENLADAIQKVYGHIDKIHFDGLQYRRDIGRKVQ